MRKLKIFAAASLALFGFAEAAPMSLDGMGIQKQWRDNEGVNDEMPDFVWGDSDTAGANKIGMYVEFQDGTTGSIVLDNVASYWNTSGTAFPLVTTPIATGFFAPYPTAGLHFLYNTAATTTFPQALPIAWSINPSTPFGGNVELDYNNNGLGSQFRVTASFGWVDITTYSSSADVMNPVPVPAAALLFAPATAGLAFLRRRKKAA